MQSFPREDSSTVLTKGSETVSFYERDFKAEKVSVPQGEGSNAWTLSFTGSVIHRMSNGEQKTYPVTQRVTDSLDSEVVVSFWDGPTFRGTLSKGDKDWSLTLSDDQEVNLPSTSSTIKVEKGTTVKFPAPGPDAWEQRDESSDAKDLIVTLVFGLVFGWLYGALQVTSQRQATVGMRVAGIYRTDLSGKGLTFAKASALYGWRILSSAVYGLGFVPQPFTKNR